MKRKFATCLIWGMALSSSACMAGTRRDLSVDPRRPFVDIVLDHLGPRQPVTAGESEDGLWLRLRNNTRYVLLADALMVGEDPGDYVLRYDVLFDPEGFSLVPGGEHLGGYSRGTRELTPRVPVEVAPGGEVLFSVPVSGLSIGNSIRVNAHLVVPMAAPEAVSAAGRLTNDPREQPDIGVRLRLWRSTLPVSVVESLSMQKPKGPVD
ncbi:MAG: hypothetical protein ABL961_16980 [Vicinamibacterales bacterium]